MVYFDLGAKVLFNLNRAEKELLKGITDQQAVDALVELNVWATLLSTKVIVGANEAKVK